MNKTIKVLYEDESLIVFNKPAGILTIPTPKKEKDTLVDIVNERFTVGPNAAGVVVRLHPCHRLDRETSGAIIFAKGKKNQQLMMREFHSQAVAKKYIAFVRGRVKHQAGELKSYIQDRQEQKFSQDRKPKLAITRYKVLSVKHHFSVVGVTPKTGRTNQIRIQFSEIGHPLLGERVYAFGKDFPVKFPRLALHACEITWRHPVLRKQITVTSELAEDMADFWGRY